MAKISPLVAIPPLVFAGLASVFLWGMMRDDPDALPSAMVGRAAPAVPAEGLEGRELLTDALIDQPGVKLVNFWASWCPPCRAEHPTLTELTKDLPIYGVALRDEPQNSQAFLNEHGNPFDAIGKDANGRIALEWGVSAPPETFIVNGEGEVLYRFAGPLIRDDYTNRFLPELEKALAAE